MNKTLFNRISNDLKDSQIDIKIALIIFPIAFFTFFFHEFGHWSVGELMGNEMSLSLNNSAPLNGNFITSSSALWSAIGGPIFTIIQAIIFLYVLIKTKSMYAFSMIFFAAFSRFFSIVFGGINLQDEARISSMLNINKYITVLFVILTLSLILWKGTKVMNLDLKAIGYFTTLSTLAILLVIGINTLTM